jgi:EF-P beta-lysylation protein EpmB
MRAAIRTVAELRDRLQLPTDESDLTTAAADQFGLFVPLEYLSRIEPGNPSDPLLLQVLPIAAEQESVAQFTADPLQEVAAQPAAGLIQKYQSRALLVTTGTCPVHCRYCFRRHFAYDQIPQGRAAWEPAIAQLATMTQIDEVLLSGGDPLALGDELLAWLIDRLSELPHLKRLRFHSRFPIMIPQRVTPDLVRLLSKSRLTSLFVVHANHRNELDEAVGAALRRLIDAGIPVLNQSVLLRGVNDSIESLVQLSTALVNLGVMPYYLHLLDRVAGAAHFEVSEAEGRAFIEAMRVLLPGYAVPRLAREEPGQPSKTVLL